MILTDKLKGIAADAKKIRESLQVVDPRQKGFDPDKGITEGDRMVGRGKGTAWMARVAECAKLFKEVIEGSRPNYHLKEAMTTSDFPLLFGDLLYRQMLGNYAPYAVSYPKYFRTYDLNDFRNLNLYTIDGGQGILSKVKEREPYPETKFTEGRYQLQVAKYGRRYGISFEMVVNDDLNAFQQRPALMAIGARRSEEYLATQQLCDVNGPHASFFTGGNANIITGNPLPSVQALQTAMKVLASQVDTEGQPIVINAVTIVAPPAHQITFENILNATQLRINDESGGATADQFMYVNNWMRAKMTLAINPYIPLIATVKPLSWFLVADQQDYSQRPAFMFGFLRGRRAPQLFIKDPDQMMLGGGDADPMEGDFNSDSIDYKLRHIFGAAQGDPKMAVSSNSGGS